MCWWLAFRLEWIALWPDLLCMAVFYLLRIWHVSMVWLVFVFDWLCLVLLCMVVPRVHMCARACWHPRALVTQ